MLDASSETPPKFLREAHCDQAASSALQFLPCQSQECLSESPAEDRSSLLARSMALGLGYAHVDVSQAQT